MDDQERKYSQGLELDLDEYGLVSVRGPETCLDRELMIPPTPPEQGEIWLVPKWSRNEDWIRFVSEHGAEVQSFEDGPRPLTDEEARLAEAGGIKHSGKIDAAPNSVKAIGDNAFRDHYALVSVTIPDSVELILEHAFSGCRAI